jgi:sensor histidine kinase regulating citrate/malate metabolism
LYHYILNFSQKLFNQKQLQHTADILKQEIAYMEEGRLLVADSHKKTKRLQSELLHTYNELEALLRQGNTETAQAYITQQEELLSSAAIYSYTDYPIINAAVSIYAHRAEAIGITVLTKINLPKKMSADENDLAVLLANLLENALLATAKESTEKRITLILQHSASQCVLEIANTFSAPVKVGEDGFPQTSRSSHGHGLGMLSLKNFLQKYDGYADFSQKDGWVRLCMYWEDTSC